MSYNYKTITNTPSDRQRILHPYCFWNDAFSSDELETICKISSTNLEDGMVATPEGAKVVGADNTEMRRSKISFNLVNNENSWVFERLNGVIEHVNNSWFNFDINGYDQYQYTEYDSEYAGHYQWHIDTHLGTPPDDGETEMRKLSLTLLLNEPEKDFTGGDLQLGHEHNPYTISAKKGTVIIFPSFQLHRVTAVTSGVRKSLVAWIVGPKFK